jgi:hypothetical protein
VHEARAVFFPEHFAAGDAGVGEEDVETSVGVEGFLHHSLHGGFVGGVEGARVDVDGGVEGVKLALMLREVGGGEVADVDCAGAVARELVGGGAADAYDGVCASWSVSGVWRAVVGV